MAGEASVTPGVTTVAVPPAASESGESAKQAPAATGVTLEQVQSAIQAALNPVFAQVRKLSEPVKPESKNTEQNWQEQVKEKLARSERQMRSTAIVQAAAANGVPPERVGIFKDVFSARHGSDVKVVARGDEDIVIHVDQLGQETSLKDAVANFLRTPDGELFKSAVQTPRSSIVTGSNSSGNGTRVFFSQLSIEEQDKLVKEGKAGAYVKEDMRSGQ